MVFLHCRFLPLGERRHQNRGLKYRNGNKTYGEKERNFIYTVCPWTLVEAAPWKELHILRKIYLCDREGEEEEEEEEERKHHIHKGRNAPLLVTPFARWRWHLNGLYK